jgi:hypothetical protein
MKKRRRKMGVDLMGHGGEYFSLNGWESCLLVAEAFGWQPAGTTRPDGHEGEWDGNYFLNARQRVTDDDAKAISRALFRALNAVSTEKPLSIVQEANLNTVMRLANYTSAGGFMIW